MKFLYNFIGLMCFYMMNLHSISFVINDLDTLANDKSFARSLNNQSQTTGYFLNKNQKTDFIWQRVKGLTFFNYPIYQTPSINNQGTLAGIFWDKTNYWFYPNVRSKHLFIQYPDGRFKDIQAPPHWKIHPLKDWQTSDLWDYQELALIGFNDKEQILIQNSSNESIKPTQFAIWQNDHYQEINSIDFAYSINNNGIILGKKTIQKKDENVEILVLYDFENDIITEIAPCSNILLETQNDIGQVFFIELKDDHSISGFSWTVSEGLQSLNHFLPLLANNHNQIVGVIIQEDKTLTFNLSDQGQLYNLNEELKIGVEKSPWTKIVSVAQINDLCEILVSGIHEGKEHSFVISKEP